MAPLGACSFAQALEAEWRVRSEETEEEQSGWRGQLGPRPEMGVSGPARARRLGGGPSQGMWVSTTDTQELEARSSVSSGQRVWQFLSTSYMILNNLNSISIFHQEKDLGFGRRES